MDLYTCTLNIYNTVSQHVQVVEIKLASEKDCNPFKQIVFFKKEKDVSRLPRVYQFSELLEEKVC